MTDQPLIGVRKLSYYLPIGNNRCGGCGRPIYYNMAVGWIQHVDPNPGCPEPWVKVVRTPEEEARIAAAEAEAIAEDRANRERHMWMLGVITDRILNALLNAHAPGSDDRYPNCGECPQPPSEIDGDPVPESWPCPVWMFISDRLEGP
jgi:hypothetical protein